MKKCLTVLVLILSSTIAYSEEYQHIVASNYISSICKDGKYLWLGTLFSGLIRFEPSTNEIIRFGHLYSEKDKCPPIDELGMDSKGKLVLITTTSDKKKHILTFQDGKFKTTNLIFNGFQSIKLFIDKSDNLWLYGELGLRKYGPDFNLIKSYTNNKVYGLDIKNGDIWWAATNKGLYQFTDDQLVF